MRKHSDETPDWDAQRNKIIGLGETSIRKSYYPELQQRIQELEKKNRELNRAYEEQTTTGEELRQQIDETALKEQELRRSEERFRALIDSSPVPIVLARDGHFIYVNKAFCTMSGWESPADVVGMKLLDFIAPGHQERVAEYIRARSRAEPAEVHYESVGIRKDGSFFPYEIEVAVITLPDGPVTMAYITDTSERKAAEEALTRSADRLRRAELVAGIGHWEFHMDTGVVLASEGARTIYGLSGDPWSIPEVQKVPLPEYRPILDEALRALIAGEKPYDVGFRIRRPADDAIRNIRSIAEYDPAAKIVFGVIQDTTLQKQAEEAIRESEAKYRAMVETSPDLIWEIDTNGRFTYLSPNAGELLGYPAGDLVGKTFFSLIPPEVIPYAKDLLESHVKNGIGVATFEVKATHGDGHPMDLEIRSVSMRDDAGQARGFRGITRDITEQKRSGERIRESEETFRSLVQESTDGIALISEKGTIIEWNEAMVGVSGISREEALGADHADLLLSLMIPEHRTPDRIARFRAAITDALRTGTSPYFSRPVEAEIVRKDGQHRFIQQITFPIPTSRGYRIGSMARDITDRKYQERTLKGQLNLGMALQNIRGLQETLDTCLSTAIETSAMDAGGIYLVSKQTGSLDLAVSRNLGEEFVKNISHFPADSDREKIVMGGKPVYVQYDKTGVVHTPFHEKEGLRAIGIIPVTSGGRVIACLNIASHSCDEIAMGARIALETISSQIGSAIEQKTAEEALLVSEERYRSLVNITDTGYVMLDNKGFVLDANEVYVRLTGRASLADIQGHTVTDWTAPYDLERNAQEVEQCFRTGMVHGLEIDYIQPDGTVRPIEINATVFHTGDRDVVLTLCRDISDRKRINVALQQARNKLNLLNAVTFQDIQTAAFSLSAYQELVKTVLSDPKAKSYLEKQELFLKKMIDTLDFAKNYQEMGMHQPRWQNVRQVFLYAISHLDFLKMKQNLELGNLEVFADPLLEKALFNIMENVLEHSMSATEVTLRFEQKPESLLLIIEDNGVGIAPEEKNMIFDRGYGKGSGLGLFLVREVLSITGMTIRETGVQGKGTRFEILVPHGVYRLTGG